MPVTQQHNEAVPSRRKVPSEKTARALAQAREIRDKFDSIDEVFKSVDGRAVSASGK